MAFKINRKLLPMKAHYFMFNAAVSPVVPYLATYARQLGFSTVFVGAIYTTFAMISLVTKPLFGYIGDKFRLHKILIIILQVVIAGGLMGIYFLKPIALSVPFLWHNDRLQFCPDVETAKECLLDQVVSQRFGSSSMLCTLNCPGSSIILDIGLDAIQAVGECLQFPVLNSSMVQNEVLCDGTCSNANVMHILNLSRRDQPTDSVYPVQLWLFAVFMVLSSAGIATLANLSNSVCSTLLGDGKRHLFGRQRAFGSFGWGLFTVLAGLMVDQLSRGQVLKDYSSVFYLMLAWMACDLIAVYAIPITSTERSKSILTDLGRLFVRPRIVVFFLCCMLCGIATSLVGNFHFWYLEDMADAAATTCDMTDTSKEYMKTLQGLVMGVQTFGGEIPLLILSGTLLKRIGYAHSMSLVLAGHGVRFLLYSVLTNPWWTLPIEMLQGLTVGLFFAVMISYSGNVAPRGSQATMQGLSSAIYDGVGKSIGGLIGGYAMKHLGGRMMFRWFGFAALIVCVMHAAVVMWFNRILPESDTHAPSCDEVSEDMMSENGAESVEKIKDGRKYTGVTC